MLTDLWNTLLYEPLVNLLAFLISISPGKDMGIAIIILTLIVKFALFPLSKKQIESQKALSDLSPELNKIKKSSKSKEEQAKETFELYKKNKVNPFSGCLILIIQIPIIFALYSLFLKGVDFSQGIYSFITTPENINTNFIGLIDITQKSIFLAVLAGITQFLQANLIPKPKEDPNIDPNSFQANFMKSMQTQMKYVFPFLIAFISYTISGAVALYIIVSNIFGAGQQLFLNKKTKQQNE